MFPRFTWKSEGRGEFNPDLRQWYEEVVYFPCNMASPFGGSGSKAAPRSSVHVQLSSPLSFLVRIRFSLISVSTLLLCFKISCYLAGLLFYPPLFLCFPPFVGNMADGGTTNDHHSDDSSRDFSNFAWFARSIGQWKPAGRRWPRSWTSLRDQCRRFLAFVSDFFEPPFREQNANPWLCYGCCIINALSFFPTFVNPPFNVLSLRESN